MALVELAPLVPEAVIDLRYATTNNITGKVLYEDAVPRLEEAAAERLAYAGQVLARHAPNLRFKIWDAHRPMPAHMELLAVNSDPRYVLDPDKSNHPKGWAVDLTLIRPDGRELDMGTDFDAFGELAHVGAQGLNQVQQANRQMLLAVMDTAGFRHWPYEWWHYDLREEYRNGAG